MSSRSRAYWSYLLCSASVGMLVALGSKSLYLGAAAFAALLVLDMLEGL